MEASGALAAGGQAGADAGQQGAGGEQQGAPDLGQLSQGLESLQESQEQLRQLLMSTAEAQQSWMQQHPGEPAPAAGEEPPAGEIDWSFLDNPTVDPQFAAQQLTGAISQEAQRQAQELVSPLQQQVAQMQEQAAEERRATEAANLVGEFPELEDPQIATQVVQAARQYAELNFPPEVAQTLGQSPAFWRAIYMAGRAAESANAEGGDGSPPAHLEGGGGAMPGGSSQDMGELIVNASRGASVLPFR